MNYHYFDFMIRKRQKLALQKCQRNRMFSMACKRNRSSRKEVTLGKGALARKPEKLVGHGPFNEPAVDMLG